MERRSFLKLAGVATAASVTTTAAKAQDQGKTAFVLVHGSWHGGWCWDLVSQHLNAAGHITVAIDLPGSGLTAGIPQSFTNRPLDPAAFATEASTQAPIGIAAYADAVIAGADRAVAMGATNVVAVGHSMGGVPISFAAAKAPEKFQALHYLAALTPVGEKPAGAYIGLQAQQEKSKINSIVLADPAVIGAIRVDPRSTDPAYLANFKEALAADVDDMLLASVMHLLTPDAPAAMYGEVAAFPEAFGNIRKTFIRCLNDNTVVPETCKAIADDMNATWPGSPTKLVDLESSHAPMFSQRQKLAELLMENA
ncbi:alpha/beta fold hydrolase [Yoonia sp. SS1-5]|uniref:Alpha/beta hydrolase n=1 Tax=Yoonia rhodophyticola TaxID=3137370 RepID=A0AAN0MD49_9RHOB